MELGKILEKYAVNCRTKQEAIDFFDFFKIAKGVGQGTCLEKWEKYEEKTYYVFHRYRNQNYLMFGCLDDVIKTTKKIITYKQLQEVLNQKDFSITVHKRKNKIVVQLPNGKAGVAKCHHKDTYSEGIGVVLATMRAYKIGVADIMTACTVNEKPKYKVGDKVKARFCGRLCNVEIIKVLSQIEGENWYKAKETGEYGAEHLIELPEKSIVGGWD